MLSSALFAGEPLLEQIAADVVDPLTGERARISTSQNRTAPAVKQVQRALLLWKLDCLPTFGADGKYGSETAGAVHRFKHDELHLEERDIIDDVGPKTVERLDEIALAREQVLPPRTLGTGELEAEEYIDAVRNAESANSGDSPAQLLTRIRQLYYPGTDPNGLTVREAAFDQLMLDAPRLEADGVTRRIVGPRGMSGAMFVRLTMQAFENAVPPEPPDNQGPYIVDIDGNRVDVGHVLLTVDALLHSQTGDPYTSFGVPAIDPASWVADLGTAAVWTERDGSTAPKQLNRLPSGEPDFDGYYAMSAPVPDLLGDLDGFGVLDHWRASGGPLSEALTQYYLGGAGIEAGFHRRSRTFFITSLGDPAVTRPRWITRISRFCDLFDAGLLSLLNPVVRPPGTWRYAPVALDRFIAWLTARRRAEETAHP